MLSRMHEKYTKSKDKFSLLFSDKAYEKGFDVASQQAKKLSAAKHLKSKFFNTVHCAKLIE